MIGKSLRTEIDINDDLTMQHSGSGKMFNKSSQHCDKSRTCSSHSVDTQTLSARSHNQC